MQRRAFLAAATFAALATFAVPSLAAAGSHVRVVTRDERGVTLEMELDNAPFPALGSGYTDATVMVFVPSYLRPAPDGRTSLVVHFHGHSTTAQRSMVAHQLREQLFESKQNAILVMPQGPMMAADGSIGKLEAPGGLARLLADVMGVLLASSATLGSSAIRPGATVGTVCLSAHSGGYHAAACAVRAGGVEINEVYLFDALYGNADAFRDWVVSGKGRSMRRRHKLVSYYGGGTTETQSLGLLAELEKNDVRCAFDRAEGTLSRQDITRCEAVFIRTSISHGGVTHELNALRDCLFASGLTRHLRTAWFDHKLGARPLERRR